MIYAGQKFASPQEALEHHGIRGMHWGIRKEDSSTGRSSKPVSAKKAASRERRATKRDVEAGKQQAKIDSLRANSSKSYFRQKRMNQKISELEKVRDRRLDDASRIREGKLTRGQKKAIIGASIVAAILVTRSVAQHTDAGDFNRLRINGKALITGTEHSWKTNENLSKNLTSNAIMATVVPKINPDYGKFGTKMNCRRCTFAYEMRRRGYEVQATKSVAATGQNIAGFLNATNPNSHLSTSKFGMAFNSMTKGESSPVLSALRSSQWGKTPIKLGETLLDTSDNSKNIFSALTSLPNGARGELGMGWHAGGGHSMAWEIIRGKPVIFDTQSGEKYSSIASFKKVASGISQAGFTRLDDLDLNDEFLKRWLQDA